MRAAWTMRAGPRDRFLPWQPVDTDVEKAADECTKKTDN
jgi:hypothetical protein